MALCLSLLIGVGACSEEEIAYSAGEENKEVILQLNCQLQTNQEVIVSRASTAENRLNDLHFYVFNAAGELTGYKKLVATESSPIPTPGPETVTVKAITGEAYIYALANLNGTIYYLDDADKNKLTGIDEADVAGSSLTRDEFLAIDFKRQYGNASHIISPNPTDGQFMMSGYLNGGKAVTITAGTNGAGVISESNVIRLYRILAKNTFTIEAGNGVTFTPSTYELHNVAVGGKLVNGTADATTADVESSYSGMAGETLTFYLPENIRSYRGGEIKMWKDRETNTYTDDVKSFDNAPDNSSYIVIRGNYKKGTTIGEVSYAIHFGNFSNTGSLEDFNIRRNYSYKYKVKVNGVEDIKVEAEVEGDNPYVEGLVIDSEGGESFDLDAHYEARVLTFSRENIKTLKEAGKGYIVRISTPFGYTENLYVTDGGIFNAEGDVQLATFDGGTIRPISGQSLFNGEDDYGWLRFVRNVSKNRISGQSLTTVAKYPGDNNEYANKYGASWVNVFFMLKALYENADSNQDEVFSNDGYAYYTCFVDENYYKGKSWTVYSNCAPRTILIANQLSVSTDRKSLYAKVRYSLSQRSITTFYHFGFNGYPYGTENITEEELSTAYYLNKNNLGEHKNPNAWNARNSAVQSNKEKSWYPDTNMIVPADGRQPMYQQAVRACMSRNRDLNGNGTIEANEVKWYMASVDQYRGLWYGEGALNSVDPDARLFRAKMSTLNDNDKENAKYHYFTASTGTNSIFWAEEGLSTSNKEVNTGWQHANLVRCVRTLASDDGLYEANKFYQYSDNIFTLTGLTATKGTTETIDIHLERDEINGLSSRIQVSKDYLKQKMVDGGWNNNYYTIKNKKRPEYDPCKYYYEDSGKTDKGIWRMPNQKELGLMSANNLLSGYVTCRTDYSGSKANGAYRSSYGFWFQGTNVTVHATDADLKVRCVKDVK